MNPPTGEQAELAALDRYSRGMQPLPGQTYRGETGRFSPQTQMGQQLYAQFMMNQADPLRQAQIEKTQAEAEALRTPPAMKAGDVQVLETDQGFVAFNKLTGQKVPLNLNPKITRDRLAVQEFQRLEEKIASGEADQNDLVHRNNLIAAGTNINMPRPAPIGFYNNIDMATRGLSVANDLLEHFKPGGAGWDSAGPINAVWTYLQDKFGVIPPEKQEFRQDSTRLFSVIKDLNQEARLSDADLKFLIEAVPKRRTNPKAYIAGLQKLKKTSTRNLQVNINRLKTNKYNVAEENMNYYNELMQPIDITQSAVVAPKDITSISDGDARKELKEVHGMTDAEIDAYLRGQ